MKIEKFRLCHFPATRSARVLWALYETADCPVEVEVINLYGGQQNTPAYLARNPNHNVPVLEISWDDGSTQTMLESAAMISFLADAYPEKGLAPLPGASPERADYLQMLHFCGGPVDMMLWQIRIHEHILPQAERDERTIARYRGKFTTEAEPQIAARLEKHDFICGTDFSAADCMTGHIVSWARGYGLCQDMIFRRYLSRVSKRPAFAKAFADANSFNVQPPAGAEITVTFNG